MDEEIKDIEEIKNEVGQVNFGALKESKSSKKKQEMVKKEEEQPNPTREIIGEIHKQAVIEQVKNSEEVQKRVLDQAEKSIDNELESLNQEGIARKQETTYNANKEACKNYGIDSSVPLWQIRLMKVGSAVWFVIYWVIASLIICPINVFAKGLKSFFKQTWVVILLAVLIYLLIAVGIPMIITFASKYIG